METKKLKSPVSLEFGFDEYQKSVKYIATGKKLFSLVEIENNLYFEDKFIGKECSEYSLYTTLKLDGNEITLDGLSSLITKRTGGVKIIGQLPNISNTFRFDCSESASNIYKEFISCIDSELAKEKKLND